MAKKDVDAAATWEPWIQKMVHDENAKIIATEDNLGHLHERGGQQCPTRLAQGQQGNSGTLPPGLTHGTPERGSLQGMIDR